MRTDVLRKRIDKIEPSGPTLVHVIDFQGNESYYHWGTGEPATAEEIEIYHMKPEEVHPGIKAPPDYNKVYRLPPETEDEKQKRIKQELEYENREH